MSILKYVNNFEQKHVLRYNLKIIESKTATSKPKDDGENNHMGPKNNKPEEKETSDEESGTKSKNPEKKKPVTESNNPEEEEFATESNTPGKGPGLGNGNSKIDDPGWAGQL